VSIDRFGSTASNDPHDWSPDCLNTCTQYVLGVDYDALAAENAALRAVLRDLLDDMAEEVSRHHRDKYRVYQITPETIDRARALLGEK
jgi:hypothetical protein